MTTPDSFRAGHQRHALRSLSLCVAALLFIAPAPRAEPVTYNLTLSPTLGQYGGTGTLTVESAPSASGLTVYTAANHSLDNLTFTVGGQTFTLAGDPYASVEFLNGQLWNVSFAETIGNSPDRYTLDTSSQYVFYSSNGFNESAGAFTALPAIPSSSESNDSSPFVTDDPPVTTTPGPGSLVLLGSAMVILGALMVRRMSTRHS